MSGMSRGATIFALLTLPFGFFLSALTVVALVRSGFQFDLHGAPKAIFESYASVRHELFSSISWLWPTLVFPIWAQDAICAWIFFSTTNNRLFRLNYYNDSLAAMVIKKEAWLRSENRHDGSPDIDKGVDDVRLEGRFFAYPWVLRSFPIVVLMGPFVYLLLVWKLLFPSYLIQSTEVRSIIRRGIVWHTFLAFGVLSLSLVGAAFFFYWSYLESIAHAGTA